MGMTIRAYFQGWKVRSVKSHRCLEVFLVIPEARFPGFAASANPIPIGLACPKHARYPTNCGPCQDP